MQKISPFLWFDGQAEEAMRFYASIVPDSRIVSVSRMSFKFTPAISFFVDCKTQGEVDELWEKLSAGGRKNPCGWLTDKYGVSWQIVPSVLGELLNDPDKEKSARVMSIPRLPVRLVDVAPNSRRWR